ncbi:MAG TPA: hypothetical protein VGQ49_00605 [Bryobacteraceae bacterium]|nr:hypothetical protein [Bryobacteraceae bacterium]
MTDQELLKLAESNPTAFVTAYEQREAERRAARRARYAANPEKYRALSRKWRDKNLERERDRARRTATRQKSVKDLYRQLMQEAA